MKDLWQRIEFLMMARCPNRYARLPGPTSPTEIGNAEETIGTQFPDDLRQLLEIHNGTGDDRVGAAGLLETYFLCSAQDIAKRWKYWRDFSDFEPEIEDHPFVKRMAWNPKWIPFASNGESHFCIDLDPAPGGTVGQVFYHHYQVGPQQVYARSLREFLEHFIASWERGTFQVDPKSGYVRTGTNSVRPLICPD